MNGTSLISRFSTLAVIAVAIGLALLQGKAFAQANEVQAPLPSISTPAAALPSISAGPQEVAIVDAPGGNFGEGEDDEDDEDDEGYGEDDD
ncbi:MAG: hypothetical protein RLZZ426_1283 [Actinomycetota bacterium]|jgi:hypothetical protein